MRADVGLVQRRGVQDGVGAGDRAPHERAVGDRADQRRVRRGQDVEPDDLGAVGGEHAAQRLAEVPGAAGDEDAHTYDHTVSSHRRLKLRDGLTVPANAILTTQAQVDALG